MLTHNKKAVIYCRVSTKEQVDEGGSLATQEKLCKEYALKNGYEIVQIYIEQGESAKNADRTQLKRLIEFCTNRKNCVTAVIAYKVDRIARNIDDYRYIRVLLKRYGVEIKSTSEYFEDTPAGRFMENIIANVAQFDNDVRTERSIGGMRDAMREGRYVWAAPLGYTNKKLAGKSNIFQNEKSAIVLKLFIEVSKNKSSVDEIRRQLQPEGLTTKNGKILTKSHVYKLLNNECYTGWIIKFGERHKGIFEPLVSEELFEQVQRVLKRRAHRGFVYQNENPNFPLRRFVFHCTGKKATGYWAKGRHKKYAYYRFIGIAHSDVPNVVLDEAFANYLNQYRLDPIHLLDLKSALQNELNSAIDVKWRQAEKLRYDIADLKNRQTSLIEKNNRGIVSDSVLKHQLYLIDEKLLRANAELVDLPDKKEDIEELFKFTEEYLKNPGLVWAKAPFKQKVELQWFEFPKGVTLKDGKFRTEEIASIFKVKDTLIPVLSSMVPSRGQNFEPQELTLELSQQYVLELNRLAKILKDIPYDKQAF